MKSSSKDQRHVQKQRALAGKESPEFKSKGRTSQGHGGSKNTLPNPMQFSQTSSTPGPFLTEAIIISQSSCVSY